MVSILLQAYDYEVVYKPGSSNSNADFLSRLEHQEEQQEDPSDDIEDEVLTIASEHSYEQLPTPQVNDQDNSNSSDCLQGNHVHSSLNETNDNTDSESLNSQYTEIHFEYESELHSVHETKAELDTHSELDIGAIDNLEELQ